MLAMQIEDQNHCNVPMSLMVIYSIRQEHFMKKKNKELTVKQLAELFCHDDAPLGIIYNADPNWEKTLKVEWHVTEYFCCYEEIYHEKKRSSKQATLDAFYAKEQWERTQGLLVRHFCEWPPVLPFTVTHQAFLLLFKSDMSCIIIYDMQCIIIYITSILYLKDFNLTKVNNFCIFCRLWILGKRLGNPTIFFEGGMGVHNYGNKCYPLPYFILLCGFRKGILP